MTDILDYYNRTAEAYSKNTGELDMEHVRTPFLEILDGKARILDLGCGPGRDAQVFHALGHYVTAMDGSSAMCGLARQRLPMGVEIIHATYADMNWKSEFDGVWACASLVHLNPFEMLDVLHHIFSALRKDGVFYASLKMGVGKKKVEEREFWHWTEKDIHPLLVKAGFTPYRHWVTMDARKEKPQLWLNVLARKFSSSTF
jgi:SAM-dependent methyltransferase